MVRRPTEEELDRQRAAKRAAAATAAALTAQGHAPEPPTATRAGWASSCPCGWAPQPTPRKAPMTTAISAHLAEARADQPQPPLPPAPRQTTAAAAKKKPGPYAKKRPARRGLPTSPALPVKPASGWAKQEAQARAKLQASAEAIEATPRATPGAKPSTYKLGASPAAGQ